MTQKYFSRTKTTIKTQYSQKHQIKKCLKSSSSSLPAQRIFSLLQKKVINKKRHTLQILKQFLLFSDSSFNSSITYHSSCLAVLLGEQKLHSLTKILQTQLIERKIWAFLNLRLGKFIRNLTKAVPICSSFLQAKQAQSKCQAFQYIRLFAQEKVVKLNHHKTVSITIANKTPTKSLKTQIHNKSQYNMSRQTEVDSYGSQRSIQFRGNHCNQYTCTGCNVCCCGVVSCCGLDYNLQQRMQYLRWLEQYAKQNGLQ